MKRSTRSGLLGACAIALFVGPMSGCAASGWLTSSNSKYDATAARAQYRRAFEAQASEARAEVTPAEKLSEGDLMARRGERQRAMLAYFQAASMAPSDLEPRLRLAYLQIQDTPERARESFQALAKEFPDSGGVWSGLGLAHLAVGELEPARAAIEKAIDLAPARVDLHAALGSILERAGEPELARQVLHAALAQHPDEPLLLNNLAVSHLAADDPAAAEPLLRRAASLQPQDAGIQNNLGLAVGLQGRLDEALGHFRRAGDEQAALNNLGYVHLLVGDRDQALATYERALLAGGPHGAQILANLERALDAR